MSRRMRVGHPMYNLLPTEVEGFDFHGETAGALWEDTKFAVHHFRDVKRLALVGETKWQEAMATFCKPFTTAEVRDFESSQAAAAHDWLTES